MKKIKLLKDVPQFVGTDLKNYGPFKAGELVELPDEIADILLIRQMAEEVKESVEVRPAYMPSGPAQKKITEAISQEEGEAKEDKYERIFKVFHSTKDGFRTWLDLSRRKENGAFYLTVGSDHGRASIRLYPDELAVLYVKLQKILMTEEW